MTSDYAGEQNEFHVADVVKARRPHMIMSTSGETFPGPDINPNLNRGGMMVRLGRIGKKAAGRVLDGREWAELPQLPPLVAIA